MKDENLRGYVPKPLDTAGIDIPEEIQALCESLARNTHENWAQGRRNEGWTYGPQRDDAKKQHPCLVPYEELTEEEKEYDRVSAMETIRLILKLGFRITKEENPDKREE